MECIAISDQHGYLPELDSTDLVLIAGDVVPLLYQANKEYTYTWYKEKFIPWINDLKCDKVIFIAGNHDLALERSPAYEIADFFSENTNGKAVYLCNNSVEYKDKIIFGTPCCSIFGNWAFMYENDILKQKFSRMPENCDIVISHNPPYGACDRLLQTPYLASKGNLGSHVLMEVVLEKKPKKLICGHLHSGSHCWEQLGDTMVCNVSLIDEDYQPDYEPLKFSI